MKRFYVFNAGCVRRGLDAIHIQKHLLANGWALTRRMRRADLIVIATCGVVRLNEAISLDAIAKAARKKSRSAEIVLTGCLPKIHPEEINKFGDFAFVPSGELQKFDAITQAATAFRDVAPPDSVADNPDITNYLVARSFCRRSPLYKRLFRQFGMSSMFLRASVLLDRAIGFVRSAAAGSPRRRRTPYFNIRIADGCVNRCAFCATQFATGPLRSKPPERIVEEFRSGLAKGYKLFQLIAEDTGCYGLDLGVNLPHLLRRLFAEEGDYQLIIIDCSPRWLAEQRDELLPLLIENQDRIKELFVPLQSGSDRMLERMERKYNVEQVRSALRELNERAPGIALRTSLLVGFPGESEADFEATKRFLSEVSFAEVAVNRYEDRPRTRSSEMPDKTDQETIEKRARLLAEEMNCLILS